ncbi:MAG: Organic hydroperoxide resistance transcriptional regulator [Myxococcaceae bacterium]|nr:Organic hydroperoxide resistance transcriptional regulator [Myxococcaceae bacterium]
MSLDTLPVPPLGNALDFLRILWGLDHSLQSASKRMEATLGVTGPQRMVVRIVGRFPGMSAGRLAEILHIHPSSVTGILKRLDRKGLITRRADPRDGRRAFLGLTEKGRKIDVRSEGTVEAAIVAALATLDRKTVQRVREALVHIAAVLKEGE